MFELICLVVILWILIHGSVIHVRRWKVRNLADRIINGKDTASEKQIFECFTWLLNANNWLNGKSEQDGYRVERLREMRNEMVTPHNLLDTVTSSKS